jgi:hypothetical protein
MPSESDTTYGRRDTVELQKKRDGQGKLTDEQAATLAEYQTKAANIFRTLGIDVNSKPAEVQRLCFMMLLYLDRNEAKQSVLPQPGRRVSSASWTA